MKVSVGSFEVQTVRETLQNLGEICDQELWEQSPALLEVEPCWFPVVHNRCLDLFVQLPLRTEALFQSPFTATETKSRLLLADSCDELLQSVFNTGRYPKANKISEKILVTACQGKSQEAVRCDFKGGDC